MIEQELDADQPVTSLNRRQLRPLNSLVAAAKRITSDDLAKRLNNQRAARSLGQEWQADAWAMYDQVGEQRFLATTLAGRLGQARIYCGKLPDDATERPEPIEADKAQGQDAKALAVLQSFGGGSPTAVAQIIARLGVNLFVAGDGWLVGVPKQLLDTDADAEREQPAGQPPRSIAPVPDDTEPDELISPVNENATVALEDLQWRMHSVHEVEFTENRTITIKHGDGKDERLEFSPDQVILIRVWEPHPRYWWQADSPTRASLPVLRELVGLTMHISANIDSRLAGAGVFLVPQSASDAIKRERAATQAAAGEEVDDDEDPFTESLIEAMLTPINDRSNASALVPLVVTVPDESIEKFKHITFDKPLDAEAREDRDEAIRRLALGQDAPPEILLGTGGMNHWGAWLVREDTISTHIEPRLALICDALTTQFLHPVLIAQGMDPELAQQYVVWYDVDHLIMRPNRSQDAAALHAAGVISDDAYRDAAGFGDADAPKGAALDLAVSTALDMVRAAPSLAADPGLPALVDQIRAVISGTPYEPSEQPPSSDESAPEQPPATGGPPNTDQAPAGDQAPPEAQAASAFELPGQAAGLAQPVEILEQRRTPQGIEITGRIPDDSPTARALRQRQQDFTLEDLTRRGRGPRFVPVTHGGADPDAS